MGERFLLSYLSVIFMLSNVAQVDGFSKRILDKFLKPQHIHTLLELLYHTYILGKFKVL